MPSEDTVDVPLAHRRAGFLAVLALLVQATAPWLVWWVVQYRDASTSIVFGSQDLWSPQPELVHTWAVRLSSGLVLLPLPVLFVRVAAVSWRHEPRSWRRDLWIVAGLQGAALASCLLWPAAVPYFWGGGTYSANATIGTYELVANPGLGWWLVASALLLVLGALRLSYRKDRPD